MTERKSFLIAGCIDGCCWSPNLVHADKCPNKLAGAADVENLARENERLNKSLDKAHTWLAELDFDFGGVRSAFASVVHKIDKGDIAGARKQAENWRTGFPVNEDSAVLRRSLQTPQPQKGESVIGKIVRVENSQFTGFGYATADSGPRKRVISVLLENGNVWDYDATTVRAATPEEIPLAPKYIQILIPEPPPPAKDKA